MWWWWMLCGCKKLSLALIFSKLLQKHVSPMQHLQVSKWQSMKSVKWAWFSLTPRNPRNGGATLTHAVPPHPSLSSSDEMFEHPPLDPPPQTHDHKCLFSAKEINDACVYNKSFNGCFDIRRTVISFPLWWRWWETNYMHSWKEILI